MVENYCYNSFLFLEEWTDEDRYFAKEIAKLTNYFQF